MRALIAMSGGVDSSVAAYLMKNLGYDCMGITMKLFHNEDIGIPREHSCCSLDDVEDARSVAYSLDIPYHVFNFSDKFEETVIKRFIDAYENGMTPNPCVDCNRHLKFDKLYLRAKELDYDFVVTGHYARIEKDPFTGKYLLKKAVDPNKDQSYVLYMLTQDQLAHTQFPLGSMTKPEVRSIAEAQGFINARKHDSQDICFVQNGDYADFIEGYTDKKYPEGNFLDLNGNILGGHKGVIRYTIGQHKGLGGNFADRMYVVSVDPKENTVILGTEESLYSRELIAEDFNWQSGEAPSGEIRCLAKIRYRHREQPAAAIPLENNRVKIIFDEPQRAVTPGQSAVIYGLDGETVLGGGTIIKGVTE